jgi:hypothetical protein
MPASFTFRTRKAFHSTVGKAIPLLDELANIFAYMGFKLDHTFRRKYMGDDFALPRVVSTITGVEQTSLN